MLVVGSGFGWLIWWHKIIGDWRKGGPSECTNVSLNTKKIIIVDNVKKLSEIFVCNLHTVPGLWYGFDICVVISFLWYPGDFEGQSSQIDARLVERRGSLVLGTPVPAVGTTTGIQDILLSWHRSHRSYYLLCIVSYLYTYFLF